MPESPKALLLTLPTNTHRTIITEVKDQEPTSEEPDAPEIEAVEEPKKETLHEQVDRIIGNRRTSIKEAISEWIIFSINFGRLQLYLDDCPVALSRFDRRFVINWLRDDEKFDVKTPRFGGRVVIYLSAT